MLVVVVFSVPAAWVANTVRTQRQAAASVQAAGGLIEYDYEQLLREEPSAPAWLRRWLGNELFQNVTSVTFDNPISADTLAVVAKFDRLEVLSLADSSGICDGFRQLQGLRHLTTLDVSGAGVTDDCLAAIARISSIQKLELYGVKATDEGFARLASLPALTDLDIVNCPNLSDSGAARMVEGMPRLQAMSLTGGSKSLAATLAALARHHPDLGTLDIEGTGATNDDLKTVGRLANLEALWLSKTRITDEGLVHLRPLKNLAILWLDQTGVTDEGLKHLGGSTSLRRLHLNSTRVGDAGMVHLEKLPLESLDLSGSLVTDAGMPAVGWINSLRNLSLARLPLLTDAGLGSLHRLANLGRLSVGDTKVTPEGIAALQQAVPSLLRVNTLSQASLVLPLPTPVSTSN